MATANKAKLALGSVIAGKYRVTRELGRGGMAAVYEAENVDIGKRIAIKVLAAELTSSAIVVERFLREARAAAAIRSPYICDVYDSGRLDDGRPFLVLELLEGESLYERMTHERTIDVGVTLAVTTQACRGLTRAHAAGIVHRDLKPENLFLTKDEEGELLTKILDFGLAKFYAPVDEGGQAQARLTREGAVFGTPAYMSPEQVRGQGAVDHRADLWALGCIVYECLTARTVWSTEQGVAMTFAQIASSKLPDPMRYRPDLPVSFQAWFYRALHRDIEQRFQTARELADELSIALQGRPIATSGALGTTSGISRTPRLELAGHDEDDRPTQDAPAPSPSAPMSPPLAHPAFGPPPNKRGATESSAEVPVYMSEPAPAPRSSRAYFAAPDARASLGSIPHGAVGAPSPSGPRGEATTGPPKGGAAGRVVAWMAGLALLGAGVYGGWNLLHAQGGLTPVASTALQPSAAPRGSGSASAYPSSARPDDGLPFRPMIADAQAAIAKGDLVKASKDLDRAFAEGGHGYPRTMREHLAQALEASQRGATCKLTGLGRPRTYDLAEDRVRIIAASRPSIALGPKGAVIVWTEQRDSVEGAWAVALDETMRAKSDAIAVTPEGQAIGRPELVRSGDRFVLTYWDATGQDAGIHVRWLDGDGKIAGPPVKVAKSAIGVSWPSLAPTPDGFTAVWVEAMERSTEDLWARRLDAELQPKGDPFRLTFLRPSPPIKARARFPVAAFHKGALRVAFRLEREADRRIQHLIVPEADLASPKALAAGRAEDVTAGAMELINTDRGRAVQPSLACAQETCFLTWNDEGGDGWAAYFEKGLPTPLWRKRFARQAKHPAVAMTKDGAGQIFWFEGSKVMTSPIDRDGTTSPSKIARVSGDQPLPSVTAGTRPGEWFVAWLDYEAGHLEPYAARVQCAP